MSSLKWLVFILSTMILIMLLGLYLCWDISIFTMCLTPYIIGIYMVCEDIFKTHKSERWRW